MTGKLNVRLNSALNWMGGIFTFYVLLICFVLCCGGTRSVKYCNYLPFLSCNYHNILGFFSVWFSFPCCMLGVRVVVLVAKFFTLVMNLTLFYGSSHPKITKLLVAKWYEIERGFVYRSLLDRWFDCCLVYISFISYYLALLVVLQHLFLLSRCSVVKIGIHRKQSSLSVTALIHLSIPVFTNVRPLPWDSCRNQIARKMGLFTCFCHRGNSLKQVK